MPSAKAKSLEAKAAARHKRTSAPPLELARPRAGVSLMYPHELTQPPLVGGFLSLLKSDADADPTPALTDSAAALPPWFARRALRTDSALVRTLIERLGGDGPAGAMFETPLAVVVDTVGSARIDADVAKLAAARGAVRYTHLLRRPMTGAHGGALRTIRPVELNGTLVAREGPMLFISTSAPDVGLVCTPEDGRAWSLGSVLGVAVQHELQCRAFACSDTACGAAASLQMVSLACRPGAIEFSFRELDESEE